MAAGAVDTLWTVEDPRESGEFQRQSLSGPASATIGGLATHGRLMVLGVAESMMEASPLRLIAGCRAIEGWYSGTSIDAQDTLAFGAPSGVRSMNEVYPPEQPPRASIV
jgi:D-arabinose 1-dehydrogenase-like Zn-dependent alcohol dehydrogenase